MTEPVYRTAVSFRKRQNRMTPQESRELVEAVKRIEQHLREIAEAAKRLPR